MNNQIVVILWWWLLAAAIGLLAWPLAFRLLRFVPDRGYSAARPLGLLLGTYAWWLLGSLGFLTTSLGSALAALALTAAVSAWLYRARRSDDPASVAGWLCKHGRYVLAYELVFLAAFAGWAYFRAHSPAINHTEKPMEFAFLNAILRSPGFPPNDPWLAGYGISYYYMGYVMLALLTRVSGTTPGVAYNTAHALWFTLFAAGAMGVGYNLVASDEERGARGKALLYGLLAAVLLVVMGNLGGALELAHQNGVGSPGFWKWLDVAELSGPATSGGGLEPQRGSWWWWRASRVINDYTLDGRSQHNDTTVIDEFPQFSFILGDMHPHVLGLPFALLAITLAFNLYRSNFRFRVPGFKPLADDGPPAAGPLPPATFLLYAVALGALGFLNTWDYPLYLALAVAAYGLRRWQEEGLGDRVWLEIGLLGAAMGIVGFVLYLPFYLSFESQARGLFPNLFNGTRFSQFFVMFGPFLVIGACFFAALRVRAQLWLKALGWSVAVLAIVVIVALAIGVISPEGRTYLRAWLQGEPLPGLASGAGDVVISRLVGRVLGTSTPTLRSDGSQVQVPGSSPWVPLLLTGSLVLAVLFWRESFSSPGRFAGSSPGQPTSPSHFVLLLFVTGAAVVLGIEFVFLGDAFGGTRMNTIFKFYYQVWALWSMASAYGVYYVIDRTEDDPARAGRGGDWGAAARTILAGLMAVTILGGLVYPLMAIPARAAGVAPLTLDGMAYLAQENPDEYAAIQWLNANVSGAPVILEAPGDSFRADTSRVSGYTGLPTLLGWRGHEAQWRKNFTQGAEREAAIAEIYNSRNLENTRSLLDKYGITYIYVGPSEQAQYSPAGLAKFDAIANVVFGQGGVTIYKVRR